jgi:protein-S-isoprenylcysteine O-methyltransferase Ste14
MGTSGDEAGSHGSVRLRLWPPFALIGPGVAGLLATVVAGEPFTVPGWAHRLGWLLIIAYFGWNGWALTHFVRGGTGLLPGEATSVLLTTGPYRLSRNPWYLGHFAAYAGCALILPSVWALLALPVGIGLVWWGAVLPEERFLRAEFGDEYEAYARRVRRWL